MATKKDKSKKANGLRCIYCGAALTGAIDDKGWTQCQHCKKWIWFGVGLYND